MDENKKILEDLITSVWDKLGTANQNKTILFACERLKQYEVIIGMPTIRTMPKIDFIGYPVQVRKGVGAFGSDVVLIREVDGQLSTWENQGFLLLTKEELEIVMPLFEENIEYDKANKNGYSIRGNSLEKGYIVENSEYKSEINSTVTITKTKDNKNTEQTILVG